MYTERLLNFLDQNIREDDRKVYNKLLSHIKKRHTKSLSSLVSTYNIDKNKIIFANGDDLTDNYINKLELLITYCKRIIDNKINISTYDASLFTSNGMLDLSDFYRVDDLLKYLYTFDKYYDEIVFSKDLIKNPLLILTITTRKRLDLGLIEKHAFDFCNNHAIVENQVKEVHSDLSAISNFKKNYILEKKLDAIVEPEVVKEAIMDYFKSTGELYYICAETEEQVSRSVNALIESKSHQDGKSNSTKFKLFESLLPLVNSILCLSLIIFTLITKIDLTIIAFLLFGYSAFTMGLYIKRIDEISDNRSSFTFKYYDKHPSALMRFKLLSGAGLSFSIIYLVFLSKFYTLISTFNRWVFLMFNNQVIVSILTVVLISLGFVLLLVGSKLFKKQFSNVGLGVSLFYLIIVLSIRTNLFSFMAYEGASIFFATFGLTTALYILLKYDVKIRSTILLTLFVIDIIMLLILNDEFYLRLFF